MLEALLRKEHDVEMPFTGSDDSGADDPLISSSSNDEQQQTLHPSMWAITYDQLMQVVVEEYENVSFVSLYDEPEDDLFVAEPYTYTSIDGLHPTSAGYAIWYNKARPYFEAALQQ